MSEINSKPKVAYSFFFSVILPDKPVTLNEKFVKPLRKISLNIMPLTKEELKLCKYPYKEELYMERQSGLQTNNEELNINTQIALDTNKDQQFFDENLINFNSLSPNGKNQSHQTKLEDQQEFDNEYQVDKVEENNLHKIGNNTYTVSREVAASYFDDFEEQEVDDLGNEEQSNFLIKNSDDEA